MRVTRNLPHWLGNLFSNGLDLAEIKLDRPADRFITGRVQLVSGWFEPRSAGEQFLLKASCGGKEILLRPFDHPLSLVSKAQGFYGYVLLQEHISSLKCDGLEIEFEWGGTLIGRLHFGVSPLAKELAEKFPLNRRSYRVREKSLKGFNPPHTMVFPGLGGVGGSSINELFRHVMYRRGWNFPVYSEATDPQFWNKFCETRTPDVRWIDGHECYGAGANLQSRVWRITFLREPLSRMLSVYNYSSLVHPYEFPFSTFEEFLESGRVAEYSQTRGLLRLADIPTDIDETPARLSALALQELENNYSFVGITELFEESIFCICAMAGYSQVGMWWPVLSAPKRVSRSNLPTKMVDRLRYELAADFQVYETRKRTLLDLLQKLDFGEKFTTYKKDASRQAKLPDIYKMMECLHWRQALTDEELRKRKGEWQH